MLARNFLKKGYQFIQPDYYLNEDNFSSVHDLKKIYDQDLQNDGSDLRKRAYLKIEWNVYEKKIFIPENQAYYQTAASNQVDGGYVRQFKTLNKEVLTIPIIKSILSKNLALIKSYQPLCNLENLTIGMHFIRYRANENMASYSSPDWLHKDDEPLVFVHLINLSKSALGGDNLIADSDSKKIKRVIRLENDMETIVINKNVYHAVTPLGSKKGIAVRDVMLFTVEPDYIQH